MKKKVPIRTLFNHPAATPETEVFFSMASLKPPILNFPSPDFFRLLRRTSTSTSRRSWRRCACPSSPSCTRPRAAHPAGCPEDSPVPELEVLPLRAVPEAPDPPSRRSIKLPDRSPPRNLLCRLHQAFTNTPKVQSVSRLTI